MAEETPNNVEGGGQQPAAGTGFTQAEVDRIVGERLTRERAKFSDYDDLKTAAGKLAEIEAAQLSELEQAQKAREVAEQSAQAAMANANTRLTQAQFLAEAAKLGATHPEDAYALADKAGVAVSEDGTVTGVVEAVAALAEAGRLVMGAKQLPPRLDGGAGDGGRPGDKAARLSSEELQTAHKMGLTPEEYAKNKQ